MSDSIPTTKDGFYNANSYENNPQIEEAWANCTVEHMEAHFNLITAVNPETLKLTPHDDELYAEFKKTFPCFKLDVLEEQSLKSDENKLKWKNFIDKFKDKVDDATLGTLVRINSLGEYDEANTIFVLRLQFLVIEIARNKEGLNYEIYQKYRKKR